MWDKLCYRAFPYARQHCPHVGSCWQTGVHQTVTWGGGSYPFSNKQPVLYLYLSTLSGLPDVHLFSSPIGAWFFAVTFIMFGCNNSQYVIWGDNEFLKHMKLWSWVFISSVPNIKKLIECLRVNFHPKSLKGFIWSILCLSISLSKHSTLTFVNTEWLTCHLTGL